jgi:hypothetical protein
MTEEKTISLSPTERLKASLKRLLLALLAFLVCWYLAGLIFGGAKVVLVFVSLFLFFFIAKYYDQCSVIFVSEIYNHSRLITFVICLIAPVFVAQGWMLNGKGFIQYLPIFLDNPGYLKHLVWAVLFGVWATTLDVKNGIRALNSICAFSFFLFITLYSSIDKECLSNNQELLELINCDEHYVQPEAVRKIMAKGEIFNLNTMIAIEFLYFTFYAYFVYCAGLMFRDRHFQIYQVSKSVKFLVTVISILYIIWVGAGLLREGAGYVKYL